MPYHFEPRSIERQPAQTFWLRENTIVTAQGQRAQSAASQCQKKLKALLNVKSHPMLGRAQKSKSRIHFKQGRPGTYLQSLKPGPRSALAISVSGSPGAESFRLEITHERIVVHASTEAGFRYASQTLWEQFDPGSYFFSGGIIEDEPAFGFRAFLISLAHDYKVPLPGQRRKKLARFHLPTAMALMEQMAEARFNVVIIDIENAVRYRSHPEITRSHSAPMADLRKLIQRAKRLGLEVIPKTNFSKSFAPKQGHNDWFEPYHALPDGPEYFRRAGQIMDELIAVTQSRFFHIGMDEDHARDAKAIIAATKALRSHLLKKKVTPIIWLDLEKRYQPKAFQEKYEAAAEQLPRRDLIVTHWQYFGRGFNAVTDLVKKKYTVLCCTSMNPRRGMDATRAFALRAYQQGAAGMLGSTWLPVLPKTADIYMNAIDYSGKAFWTAG